MIIEGDNLEVLKLLQKYYLGKVKMIYIDPPYNTGKVASFIPITSPRVCKPTWQPARGRWRMPRDVLRHEHQARQTVPFEVAEHVATHGFISPEIC